MSGKIDPAASAATGGGGDVSAEIAGARAEGPASGPFSRAVVHEVFNSLEWRDRPDLMALSDDLGPGGNDALLQAPRNSLIARIVAGAGGSASVTKMLCYPFFPSHMSMPVKPGEQVWVMSESPGGKNPHGYWICRVTEPDHSDDTNFTHPERRHGLYIDKVRGQELADSQGDTDGGEEEKPFDGLTGVDNNPGAPNFADKPPDGDAESAVVNDQAESDPEAPPEPTVEEPTVYDQIYTGSISMQSVTMEPVPRFTKRPGDFVLQGSNNTLICLGQDRGWTAGSRPDGKEYSNAYVSLTKDGKAASPIPDSAGTIDIVSGRGRFYESSPQDPSKEPKDTQPRVIQNTREKLEVDKNPAAYTRDDIRKKIDWNRYDRPVEGDPDFLVDCSRIYVSMKTNGDANFNTETKTINPIFEGTMENGVECPFIVAKSDEIRIIARKDPDRDGVNGSIRLIKEGDINGDQATLYMLPDGVIEIQGSKIYLGQSGQGHGEGAASSEPYVRYSDLKTLFEELFANLQQVGTMLAGHTTPGNGMPSPGITMAGNYLRSEMPVRKSEIPTLKSERIFGE